MTLASREDTLCGRGFARERQHQTCRGLPDQETRRCALLVKRHALSPFAAPAGLAATVHCCCLALAHCRRLQASHALALAPTLLRELWPACDQV